MDVTRAEDKEDESNPPFPSLLHLDFWKLERGRGGSKWISNNISTAGAVILGSDSASACRDAAQIQVGRLGQCRLELPDRRSCGQEVKYEQQLPRHDKLGLLTI